MKKKILKKPNIQQIKSDKDDGQVLDGAIRTLAKGSVVVLFGLTLSKFLTYLWTLIIARSGPSILGNFSIGLSFLSLGETVALLGIPAGLYRLLPEFSIKNEKDKLNQTIVTSYAVILLTSSIISIVILLLSGWISHRYFPNIAGISTVIDIFAIGVPIVVLIDVTAAIMHGLKFVEYEAITRNVIENLLKVLAVVFAITFELGIIGLSAAYVAAEGITVIFAIYLLNRFVHKINVKKEHIKNKGIMDKVLFYSLPILIATPFFTVISNADILFLGHYLTANITGVYAAVSQTVLIMLLVPGIVAKLNQQVQVELNEKKNIEQMNQVMKFITKWIFILNFPIFVIFSIFANQILSLLYGTKYALGSLTFVVLLFAFLINTVGSYAYDAIEVFDKPKFILVNTGICAIVDILLCYELIPKFGLIGAGIATGTAIALVGILAQIEVYQLTGFEPFGISYVKLIVAGVIPALILLLFTHIYEIGQTGIFWPVILSIGFGMLYVLSLLMFRILDKTDGIAIAVVERKLKTRIISNFLKKFSIL